MYVIIPMAGLGSRFVRAGIALPKPLIEVDGRTLIEHSVRSFDVDAQFIFITRQFEDPIHNQILSDLLKTLRPESHEICLKTITDGAAQTCLAAREFVDNDEELVIYNCDQLFKWRAQDFVDFVRTTPCDGAVVLYNSNDPKNSFAEVRDGQIVRLVEKQAISRDALVGFHYWRRGSDFVQGADALVEKFRSSGRPECYVSETYTNLLEQQSTVLPYFISNSRYIPLGTPEDVNRYLGKVREFDSAKPKTIFCDIDGTILAHAHTITSVLTGTAQALPGVINQLNQWDSQGHRIILVTARKESTRAVTEGQLTGLGIAWDQLIMGLTSGERYLINDKLEPDDRDRAVAVNVITDGGFESVDWEGMGL